MVVVEDNSVSVVTAAVVVGIVEMPGSVVVVVMQSPKPISKSIMALTNTK